LGLRQLQNRRILANAPTPRRVGSFARTREARVLQLARLDDFSFPKSSHPIIQPPNHSAANGSSTSPQIAAIGCKSTDSPEKRIDLRQVDNYFRQNKEIFV
jgi:hypothetical protein